MEYLDEWTISHRIGGGTSNAYGVDSMGFVEYIDVRSAYYIRPVFYLNSDVVYDSGDGSIDNPYRIIV